MSLLDALERVVKGSDSFARKAFLFGGPPLYCLVSLSFCPGKAGINKTKWPRQVRELILDSDSDILDF